MLDVELLIRSILVDARNKIVVERLKAVVVEGQYVGLVR